ncbi:hypothetical protein USB125703_00897 [Pseudoclavibacter triregionum]|nr:hypothetical protein USB125703_00897 [Pseudoclavibacter triregionum]
MAVTENECQYCAVGGMSPQTSPWPDPAAHAAVLVLGGAGSGREALAATLARRLDAELAEIRAGERIDREGLPRIDAEAAADELARRLDDAASEAARSPDGAPARLVVELEERVRTIELIGCFSLPCLEAAARTAAAEVSTVGASGDGAEAPAGAPAAAVPALAHAEPDDRRVALARIVAVVDAARLDEELADEEYLPVADGHGEGLVARALLAANRLEGADHVILAGCGSLADGGAAAEALAAALAPMARITRVPGPLSEPSARLAAAAAIEDRLEEGTLAAAYPGWALTLSTEPGEAGAAGTPTAPAAMRLLAGRSSAGASADPSGGSVATAAGAPEAAVDIIRITLDRPVHPNRLIRFLNREIEPGRHGRVVRSCGFARLATRPGGLAHWDHVGAMIGFEPLADDELGALAEASAGLALGLDLALIGEGLDADGIRTGLEGACLTDPEFLAGAKLWRALPDPLPAWEAHEH